MKQVFSLKLLFVLPLFLGLFLLASNRRAALYQSEANNVEAPDERTNVWVEQTLEKMSLKEKIGQFFMVAAYPDKGEDHLSSIDSLIYEHHIGGLIFFQGQRPNLLDAIQRFQNKSEIPLLMGMDAEWGTSMRLFNVDRFPYNYTIGAANDPKLTERLSSMIGQECREMGIHINFAPVADVNSNPNNPVIGFRSYGENPKDVAEQVKACVTGMEKQSVLTSIKHFPGHGDTDVDSHYELPVVNNTYAQINAADFFPFRSGIRAGASSVMIGHLNVPSLDPSGTPSSLSRPIIQNYLKGELGFKGLVISDALGMKAVADRYGKVDVVVKAFEAGCDILLFPESVGAAISAIESKVRSGQITIEEINQRCEKVLLAKYKTILHPSKLKKYTKSEIEQAKKQLYEKSLTIIKNEDELLPIKRFDQKIAHVSIGTDVDPLVASMDLVAPIDHFHFYDVNEALRRFGDKLDEYDIIITSLHAKSVLTRNDYGMPANWRDWLKALPEDGKNILALFGNPYVLSKNVQLDNIHSILIAYENHRLALDRAGQLLMGTFASNGTLPVTVNNRFKRGTGIKVKWAGRLKESQPEELGISPNKLSEIDTIVRQSIEAGAFPGCQILVAIDGKVIYRKSFGYHTYANKIEVQNDDLYDLASITKIAATTISLMHLNSQDSFSLNSKLSDYLPELTLGTPYASMNIRTIMSHQAGLKPWIPFYVKTLANKRPSPYYYSTTKTDIFNKQVADDLWIRGDYTDVIYKRILETPLLTSRKYRYSDNGYYFLKRIIEKKTKMSLEDYVSKEFYAPMGLNYMGYNPNKYFPKNKIPPTENDTIFRKQLVHGFVHDQGAAMMGGVGGHAGLFSNAGDLAAVMQLFLNNGNYGGTSYIDPDVIKQYTKCQFCPKNRRGAGFDKPTPDRIGGPTSKLVSLASYGHSGFTGTLAWADPEYKVNFVFLSNRVFPDADNWKIVKMNIRTEIQRVIYEALISAK